MATDSAFPTSNRPSLPASSPQDGITLRPGTLSDVPAVIALFDIAVEWLVSQGRTGQWGTTPASQRPDRIKAATEFAESGGLWLAVDTDLPSPPSITSPLHALFSLEQLASTTSSLQDPPPSTTQPTQPFATPPSPGNIIGALSLGPAWSHVPPATEPEVYVQLLITNRKSTRRGVGGILLEKAKQVAREEEKNVIRVDCYAGDDMKLVAWYESQGFKRDTEFEVKGWKGCVLSQRLDGEASRNEM